jgi:hypothetical protein
MKIKIAETVKIFYVEVKKIIEDCKVKEISVKTMEEMQEHAKTLKRYDEVMYVLKDGKRIYRSGKGMEFEVNNNPYNGCGPFADLLFD